MNTYQDLVDIGINENDKIEFVLQTIRQHKSSDKYSIAYNTELYYTNQNPTIMNYQRFLYNQYGRAVPDIWKPNHKIASNWYEYFTTQAVQYLLGNGVLFKNESTAKILGKNFNNNLQMLATYAKNESVGFGFWNYDHLDVFKFLEFAPLYDEENGALMAGVRFWQISDNKPLRATLYEIDGYTEYMKLQNEEMKILYPKQKYTKTIKTSRIGGTKIYDGQNYDGFPIIPLWNVNKQSDLVGRRNTIDAYDLMCSGLINNVDEGEFIYWILKNCGGMREIDDAKFIEQLKLTHVAHVDGDEGADASAHKSEVPFAASETALQILEKQLYKDFMALKVEDIASGAVTATQIQAAYEPLNLKTDRFEYCVTDFILRLFELLDIDDEPIYTRSQMSNQSELIQILLSAGDYLSDEYITSKILSLFGDSARIDEIIKQRDEAELNRFYIVDEVSDEG